MDRTIEKKRFTLKKILTYALPSVFVLTVVLYMVFGDKSARYNADTERMTISTVYKDEFQEFIPVTGEVVPIKRYTLSATEGGVVEERIIEAGTRVEKGEPIVRMSNTNLLLTILNNQAQVNRAANDLRATRLSIEQNRLVLKKQLAKINFELLQQERAYNRAKKLYEKSIISKEEYELARDEYNYSLQSKNLTLESMYQDSLFRENQITQLELSVDRMEKNLVIVQQREEALTIRAPISGTLTSLDAEIGATKSRGEVIGRIDVLDSLKVRCPIDEHYIARVEKGRYATFTFAGNTYRLVVSKVYMEVTNNQFEIDLKFTGSQAEGIRRGQTLHLRLELGDLSREILLPRGGFYQQTGGQWVFKLDESGTIAEKHHIVLGRKNPEVFTVLKGLQPGDKVITSSYETFGDAEKIVLK